MTSWSDIRVQGDYCRRYIYNSNLLRSITSSCLIIILRSAWHIPHPCARQDGYNERVAILGNLCQASASRLFKGTMMTGVERKRAWKNLCAIMWSTWMIMAPEELSEFDRVTLLHGTRSSIRDRWSFFVGGLADHLSTNFVISKVTHCGARMEGSYNNDMTLSLPRLQANDYAQFFRTSLVKPPVLHVYIVAAYLGIISLGMTHACTLHSHQQVAPMQCYVDNCNNMLRERRIRDHESKRSHRHAPELFLFLHRPNVWLCRSDSVLCHPRWMTRSRRNISTTTTIALTNCFHELSIVWSSIKFSWQSTVPVVRIRALSVCAMAFTTSVHYSDAYCLALISAYLLSVRCVRQEKAVWCAIS